MTQFLPLAAANEFIDRAGDAGLTHMQLQKLVYLAHEDWIKKGNEPFLAENPQVWQYGPVFSSLYRELKTYRKADITKKQAFMGVVPSIDDPEVLKILDDVWAKYKGKSGPYLSDITHQPGTAWSNLAETYHFKVPFGLEIRPDDILNAA